MIAKRIPIALIAIALVTLACSININLPVGEVRTGPTVTEEIQVPLIAGSAVADVELTFGGGELILSPGAEGALISGTAVYNVEEFKPEVTVNENLIRISQGDLEFQNIPILDDQIENTWQLQLGTQPVELTITAGAYRGEMEFGGLAMQNLRVTDGAADTQLSFSQPNQTEMRTLRYQTGASQVHLSGLANANFSRMEFQSGAGEYSLDFSGDLQRDATVEIKSGVSSLTIIVPEGTATRLSVEGALTNVDAQDNWEASGSDYLLSGEGPTLTIFVDMGAGAVQLRNR